MNQKYFKLLPLFCLFVTLSFTTVGQTTLSSTDQALRYSIYARLGLKIIPIKLSDTSYKLQFVVEKIEENASLDNYQLSYTLLSSYEEEIQLENKKETKELRMVFAKLNPKLINLAYPKERGKY